MVSWLVLALFQNTTANKIDSEHTRNYKKLFLVCEVEILQVTVFYHPGDKNSTRTLVITSEI